MLPLGSYLRSVWGRRRFISSLARTELRARYFNTILGQFWTVLSPLMLAGVYFLLIQVIGGGRAGTDRFTLLVACVFLFYFTRNSVQAGASSIIGGSGLILNSAFPRAVLPITAVLEAFVQLVPSLIVYAVIHGLTGAPLSVSLIFLPLLLLLQTIFNLGVGMLLGTLGVYFRDIVNALQYLLRIWLYATPVIYTVGDLPPRIRSVLIWNPLFHLFASYQAVLTGTTPRMQYIAISTGWALGLLVFGGLVFVFKEREFALRV